MISIKVILLFVYMALLIGLILSKPIKDIRKGIKNRKRYKNRLNDNWYDDEN